MKMLRLIVTLATSAALVASAGPARAEASWEDEQDDATGIYGPVESSPRPSDAELDIVTARFSVEGDSIVTRVSVKQLGVALGSGGSVFQTWFTYKDDKYFFQGLTGSAEYQQFFLNNPRFYRDNPDPAGDPEELRCDCKFALDNKTNTGVFTIKTASVAKSLKTTVGAMELSGLEARTFRRAYHYFAADVSIAPEKLVFRA